MTRFITTTISTLLVCLLAFGITYAIHMLTDLPMTHADYLEVLQYVMLWLIIENIVPEYK
jgi:hypothetical protein